MKTFRHCDTEKAKKLYTCKICSVMYSYIPDASLPCLNVKSYYHEIIGLQTYYDMTGKRFKSSAISMLETVYLKEMLAFCLS